MGSNINFPKVSVPILSANTPQENSDQKVLFVGYSNAAPSIYQNIQNSESTINSDFGVGTPLARMLIAARDINGVCEFDAISVAFPTTSATAATADITLVTATEDHTIVVTIESAEAGNVTLDISDGDTATIIGDNLVTAINAVAKIDYTASNNAGVVTVTNNSLGSFGNGVSLLIKDPTSNITISGFATNSDGAGTTNIDSVLDLIGEQRYQTIVWAFNSNSDTQVVQEFLDDRFNADDSVLDGVAIVSIQDTYSNLITYGESFNSKSLVLLGDEFSNNAGAGDSYESSAILETPWVVAAKFGAVRSLRRQDGANIANLVISKNGALDSTGGAALSSKPYANTPFSKLSIIKIDRGFTRVETSNLLESGVSILGNNRGKTTIICGQVVTTYKTDFAGNSDDSFKFLNYVDTASTGREYYFNNLQSKFAQSRLTDGNLIKGRDMTNRENIIATMIGYYQILSNEDYVVARKGEDILQYFKENLEVKIDLLTGSANITFNLPIVTQLRSINAPMTLTFNIE